MPTQQAKTNGGDARLQSFVQRIEHVEGEIADLNADKSEIFKEAKGEGWNVDAIKVVVAERRKRAKNPGLFDSLEADVELYRAALGDPSRARAYTREDAEPTMTIQANGHEPVTVTSGELRQAAATVTAQLEADRRARA